MKLSLLAVGHRQPDWVNEGCAEYLKRMPRELPASVTEIKPEPRGSKTREQLLAAEKGRPSAEGAVFRDGLHGQLPWPIRAITAVTVRTEAAVDSRIAVETRCGATR